MTYNLKTFLSEDKYIDYSTEVIQTKAQELFDGISDDTGKARAAYEFVRDEIPHTFDIRSDTITVKASDVLKHKTGICHAKSNLLAALLRSQGIPTGFCYQHLTLADDDSMGYSLHCFNAIYIESRWIKVDARGNKPGVDAQFSLDEPVLAFPCRSEYGEYSYPGIYAAPHEATMQKLEQAMNLQDVFDGIEGKVTELPELFFASDPDGYKIQTQQGETFMSDMTTLQNAIETRRSRRKYLPAVLKQSDVDVLSSFISEFNAKEQVKMRLILNNGDAFNGLRKSYGMFSGVKNYVALIGDKTDPIGLEKLGYYGEWLILHATARGLGTCWVGGTFDRKSCIVDSNEKDSLVCVITVGNVPEGLSFKEKLIYRLTHRKTKTMEEMFTSDGPAPDWVLSGMKAVQKAPSAVNRQPVVFSVQDGNVTASVKDIATEGMAFDLGIAKLHFELGAGGGAWEFGNGAGFRVSTTLAGEL